MNRHVQTLAAAVAACLATLGPQTLAAQSNPTLARPQVMILGSYHMGNPGVDHIEIQADDVLSERRQREIEEVVEALARYRPTRIALEVPAHLDSFYNARYRSYLEGTHTLSRSESEQIGFRLARRLGHSRIHAVDFQKDEDVGAVIGFAAQNGQTHFLQLAQTFMQQLRADMERQQRTLTVAGILHELNSPKTDSLENMYLVAATIGEGDRYVGADMVAGRYERNLKIFANLVRITEPGDRVLAIYGSSHGKLLRQFVDESPMLELVRAEEYLAGLVRDR